MKRMYTLYCLIVFFLGFLLCACKKDDPLPQSTQTGQNTLGCLIDGKPYIPDGGPPFSGIKPTIGGFLLIRYKPLGLGIYVNAYAKSKQRINLYLSDYSLGKHSLNSNTVTKPAAIYPKDYGSYQDNEDNEYVTSSQYTGWINLTKADTTTGVVAGTFEFQAATKEGKVVNITQGRFDVNHRTQ